MGTTDKKIEYFSAQKKVAVLWLVLSGILFLLFLILSLTKYSQGENGNLIWGGFLPNIVPTLSLILGVFVSEMINRADNTREVPRFYFNLTFYLSLFYLIIFFILIIIDTLDPVLNLITIINKSNVYLGPVQGLVTLSIGLFFVKSNNSNPS